MDAIQRFKQLPPRVRSAILAGPLLLLLIATYPFQITVVPAWSLRVVDDQGVSVTGINVTQHWQHNLLEGEGHEELRKTDVEGQVVFPARKIRASLLSRMIATVGKLLREGGRAKFGVYGSVVVWGSKDNETNVAVYKSGEIPPTQIVAARLR